MTTDMRKRLAEAGGFQMTDLGDGAWLAFHPFWVRARGLGVTVDSLRDGMAWDQVPIRIMGREIMQPRLTAWYGDPGKTYRYSGRSFTPLAWAPALLPILGQLREETGHPWNSCLGNLYRDGRDSIGLHADDERELGPMPQIASLSLGSTRRFVLRHAREKGRKVAIDLTDGGLLLMGGSTQAHWLHEVPKTKAPVGARVNLTFRQIFS
jgi:alkylated DNA repair dioxygenase AlkB